MLATAPAPAGLLPRPVYTRYGHEYAQQRPDGRIALGGFSDLDGAAGWTDEATVSAPVQARLERWLHEELGIAPAITHRWSGVVGYADLALPRVGPLAGGDERIWGMGGYNGTGHVQAWVAARIVAERIVTGRSADGDLYEPLDA
jgi:glycine/D-amino acid oxidase-like deaminating enzyme